ncbi:uncharacterized protein LOC108820958 isoform X3 [Raphanus sativus]|uniref:Uncharacterized protein LOC108820958 isoform X3 n=1 Tax=Raphanus sativus TaxID=3726 RepID=A0A6J0KNN5_RAPSA|nr:uncharacterized protein LOC108820958 isoform X3 [Raphanus sativus]XP_018449505.1 uncharacterized protein LOC108820958 isoform X3 [Raphanus sativus]
MQESTLKGHAAFIQASLSRHRLRNGHHPHSTDQSVPFAGVSKPAPSNSPCSISISFTFSGVHLSIRCETMIGSFLTRGLVYDSHLFIEDFNGCFDHFRKSRRYFCFLGSALLRGKAGILHISLVPQDQTN